MSLDHGEFIARHHKTAQAIPSAKSDGKTHKHILTFIIILSVILFVLLMYRDTSREMKEIIYGIELLLGAVAAFIGHYAYRRYQRSKSTFGLYRSVLEGSRAARMITDTNDQLIYYNQRYEQLCRGVGPPDAQTLLRLFQDTDEVRAHFRMLEDKALRGLVSSIELFSKHEDQERWFSVTAQPVSNHSEYVHWVIDEVTEKFQNEQAIRDEREKLIDFTDNAPVGFFSVNEEGRFIFANATFARWVGEDLQVLLEKGKIHTYLSNPPKKAAPYDLIEGGGPRQVTELYMKGTVGTEFLASVNQTVVYEDDGRVTTRAVVDDLTTERLMRTALQESEARFQKFFEEAPVGIVLVDQKNVITDCNGIFGQMVGFEVEEIEGKEFASLIHDQAKTVTALISQNDDKAEDSTLQRIPGPQEITLKSREGSLVQTQMHARRFRETGHTVLHFIDVTEQKQLEAQFVQSQKMQAVGQLAGGIAHDFNNLLTAIIGFCDLLLLRHKPGDPSFGDIMQVKQNSNRAANLVRQLLAFSRQQTLRPTVQDITDILTELAHLIRRLIGANIELEIIHGQNLHFVRVDEGQMEQVLINLAVNARDAMNDLGSGQGELTIRTENFDNTDPIELVSEELPPGQWVRITVSDTGCGIPQKNLARIFEPFFTTKDVGDGTGLGLSTVYGIIRQTDGYLDVKSTLNVGTSFILYLPRAEEQEQTRVQPQDLKPEKVKDLTGTERILLVEDEDAVRTFSQRALTNKGYEVLAAESGEMALDIIQNESTSHLDLLITDVVMPNMDGPTLAQRIRQNNKDLKIIFISGYTEEKLKDYMNENTWFLAKPFTLKQLAEKVKDVLEA